MKAATDSAPYPIEIHMQGAVRSRGIEEVLLKAALVDKNKLY